MNHAIDILRLERNALRKKWQNHRLNMRYSLWCADAYYVDWPETRRSVLDSAAKRRALMKECAAARLSVIQAICRLNAPLAP
jgi:hypothetical protein